MIDRDRDPNRTVTSAGGMHDALRFAHFTVLGRLGEGGMGIVYRAKDEKLDRVVALKELVEGRTLRALLLEGPLPVARAVGLMVQAATGVARAHAAASISYSTRSSALHCP